MKITKRILALVLILAVSFVIYGCQSDGDAGGSDMSETMKRIKDTGKIIWGTNAEFPPLNCAQRQGNRC